jgi:hypothetical protein
VNNIIRGVLVQALYTDPRIGASRNSTSFPWLFC